MEVKIEIAMIIVGFVTSVLANVVSHMLLKKKNVRNKVNLDSCLPQEETEPSEGAMQVESYAVQLAKRLMLTKELLSLRYDELSFSKLCDYMGSDSVSEIEDFFSGNVEAPNEFLMKYADFFGIEYQWLRHGEKNIFKLHPLHHTFPLDYKKCILELDPISIFYIRRDSQEGSSGIVLQLTDKRYLIFPRTYHVSSIVGASGQSQLVSFYELIKELSTSSLFIQSNGLILQKNDFDDLFAGKVYPGEIFQNNNRAYYWWDDFLDINHKELISKNYETFYGAEFVKAQEIIKWKLSLCA